MKQWFVIDRSDVFVMLVSYPAVFLANYLILGSTYFSDLAVFVPVTLGVSILYFVFAITMDAWMKYMRYRYTELAQAPQRIAYCMAFYVGITALMVCLIFWLYYLFDVPGYRFDPVVFQWILLMGFFSNLVSVGITEATFSYRKWKESFQREYELKQLHMQRQLDVLTQQVNPHFLFNSLNSLISLIGENPQQAEAFAEELSSVYRYVLRANRIDGSEQNLTDLEAELEFIQSYYHLLKTRHGCGLNLIIDIDKGLGNCQLPPLTLQLLVENAVKHNVVLPEQPLTIVLTTDGQQRLTVSNNLQRKPSRALSNGIGLSNILARYQMLGQPAPIIEDNDQEFRVTLPLIG